MDWEKKRAIQMRDAKRRISKLSILLAATAYVCVLRFGVGLGAKSITSVTLSALALGLMASLKPAPKKSCAATKSIYPVYPVLGAAGWIIKTMNACPVKQQMEEAEKSGFTVSELCLLGGTRDMYIYDKKDIEYILRDNWKNYTKNVDGSLGFLEYFCEILGRGIFAVDGDEWQAHRKTASYMFSNTALTTKLEGAFAHHGAKLVAGLKARKDRLGEQKVNVQEIMQALTFDSICDIAFGSDPGALESSLEKDEKLDFLVRFDRIQQNLTWRFMMPGSIWKFLRLVHVGFEAQISRDSDLLQAHVQKIIDKRKQETLDNRNDLLSLYIDAANKSPDKAHLKDDAYLSDMILNFSVAGRDTTSCTLTNLFLELANSPESADRMRDEFERVVGDKNVSMDNLKELRFSCAVFNEVLRLHPPVFIDGRVCGEDDALPTGITVPKNTYLWICNHAIGRDPSRWSDPNTFNPDRWLDMTKAGDSVRRVDEYNHPVFWGGPRLCIGKDAARLEVLSIAKSLLEHFDCVLAEGNDDRIAPAPVQFYEHGLWGYFRER